MPHNVIDNFGAILEPFIFKKIFEKEFLSNTVSQNLPGFTFRQLKLTRFNAQLVPSPRLKSIEDMLVPNKYSALSSAKWQISVVSIKQNKLFKNRLDIKGHNMEPWGHTN